MMPKIFVNDINIHYQRIGQGPDVVMIHGIASNLALWLNIQRALAEEFRVTTYDLRGHGYSDMPPSGYNSADMAADLNALLDHLGIERTHLVGHSFGGLVALHYTVLYPNRVDRLILADTGIPAVENSRKSNPVFEEWQERLKNFGVSIPDDKQDDVDYLLIQTRKVRESFLSPKAKRRKMGVLPSIERLSRLIKTTSILDDFRSTAGLTLDKICRIRHQLFICYGERSPSTVSRQYLQENLPNCTSAIVPNAGHFHLLTQPEMFMKKVNEFLLSKQL